MVNVGQLKRGAVRSSRAFFRSSLVVTTDTALVPFGCGFPFSFTASAVGEGGAPHGVSHIAARSPATSWSELISREGGGRYQRGSWYGNWVHVWLRLGVVHSMPSTISIYFHAPCRPFTIIIFGRSACWVGLGRVLLLLPSALSLSLLLYLWSEIGTVRPRA